MYRNYLIMQEPGARARKPIAFSSGGFEPYRRPRRVARVHASGEVEALGDFEYEKYLTTNNRQYAGSRFQWRVARNLKSEWRDWNGTDDPGTRGREWRLVVTLRNGRRNTHEAYFQAWRED